jgi:hypothetical protein
MLQKCRLLFVTTIRSSSSPTFLFVPSGSQGLYGRVGSLSGNRVAETALSILKRLMFSRSYRQQVKEITLKCIMFPFDRSLKKPTGVRYSLWISTEFFVMKNLKSYDDEKMKIDCGVSIFHCSDVKPSCSMEVFLEEGKDSPLSLREYATLS